MTEHRRPSGIDWKVRFNGPALLNGGELGTEASVFMVPAAIATFIYVIWFLRGEKAKGRGGDFPKAEI